MVVSSPNRAGDWVRLYSRRLTLAGGMEVDIEVYPFSVTPLCKHISGAGVDPVPGKVCPCSAPRKPTRRPCAPQ